MQRGSDTPDQGITRLQVEEDLAGIARLCRLSSGSDSNDAGRKWPQRVGGGAIAIGGGDSCYAAREFPLSDGFVSKLWRPRAEALGRCSWR